jgi:hypothetical protein
MSNDYTDSRHPALKDLNINDCYICGKPLGTDTTSDHIIPDSFFSKGDQNRPQLPVHRVCNNSKSRDDRWCVKFLQFYAGFSPDAEADFRAFMDKAMAEKPYAFLIGNKNPNYRLARGLLGKMTPSIEIRRGGQTFHQFRVAPAAGRRVSKWMKLVCRGLYIRNVLVANPPEPKLTWNQYALSELKGQEQQFIAPIQRLIDSSGGTSFGQEWGTRVTYIGSRIAETANKGYLFIHFYRQVGVLAAFGVKESK